MKLKKKIIIPISMLLMMNPLFLSTAVYADSSDDIEISMTEVNINDYDLKESLAKALNKSVDDVITKSDLESLTSLECVNGFICDISPLANCLNYLM